MSIPCESGSSIATLLAGRSGDESDMSSSSLFTMRSVDLGVVTIIIGTEGRCGAREFAGAFLRGVSGPDSGNGNFSSLETSSRITSERGSCADESCACAWTFAAICSLLEAEAGATDNAD